MAATFFERLEERAKKLDSLLCVGLDPHSQELAEDTPTGAKDFCMRLITATRDLAVAYKPNAAFFEAYGAEGWQVLQQVIASLRGEVPVILDAKRGDIGSTSAAYARSAFGTLGADALTVNPYLGGDALQPFIQDPTHAVFVLCKTSNPGSLELQDGQLPDGLVYEKVARLAEAWNTKRNVGLVVGATHPQALCKVRQIAPEAWILAPGVGAQGGDLRAALTAGLRADGSGLLLPVSRAISGAADPREAAMEFNRQVRETREAISQAGAVHQSPNDHMALAEGLLDSGCVKFGSFTLKSGVVSPIYIDLRRLVSNPLLMKKTANAYLKVLQGLQFDRLAAIPYAGLPIGTAVALQGGFPLIYPRREVKAYGTRAEVEGEYFAGERVAIIDDLATNGESKFEVIDRLKGAGLEVEDVVVLIDRQGGACEALAQAGIRLHAVVTLGELLDLWQQNGRVDAENAARTREFIHAEGSAQG